MTLSPDSIRFLTPPCELPTPPLPYVVQQLIYAEHITHIKRVNRSGAATIQPTYSGLFILNGASIYISPARKCHILHVERACIIESAFEDALTGIRVAVNYYHANESFSGLVNCIGERPLSIRVVQREGCWPAFTSLRAARQFSGAAGPLQTFHLAGSSALYYATHRKGFQCIICRRIFNSKHAIQLHFAL